MKIFINQRVIQNLTANKFFTKNYYNELENITVISHKGKHVYDSIAIVRFLNKIKQ